jgi:hypothetical protein
MIAGRGWSGGVSVSSRRPESVPSRMSSSSTSAGASDINVDASSIDPAVPATAIPGWAASRAAVPSRTTG